MNVAHKLQKLNTNLHPRSTPSVRYNPQMDCGQVHLMCSRHQILVLDDETVSKITTSNRITITQLRNKTSKSMQPQA